MKPYCLSLALTLSVGASIDLHAADITELDLESLLGSTIVSASKYEQPSVAVPAAVSVITREDIRTFGWRTLMEALNTLPGLFHSYDHQYDYLGVRGIGLPGDFNTRVLLLINGNRLNDVTYDGAQVGREFPVDMDLVDRIELIMGPGGAVYGQNAMLAVINIITRKGQQIDGGEMWVMSSDPQRQHEATLHWGQRLDSGLEIVLSGSVMSATGSNMLLEFPAAGPTGDSLFGIAGNLDSEHDHEFFSQLNYGSWSFDLLHGERSKDDPVSSYYSDPFVTGQYESDSYLISQLLYHNLFAQDRIDLQGRLFSGRQHYQGLYQYDGLSYQSNGYSAWQGAELRVLMRTGSSHTLLAGFEYQNNDRIDQDALDLSDSNNNILIAASGYRAGVYIQDEWEINADWLLTLGMRMDDNDTIGSTLSPRLAVSWQGWRDTAVKLMYGRASRAPNAYETLYDDGLSLIANSALEGETIDTVEALLLKDLSPNLQLRLSAYGWKLKDVIQLGTDAFSGLPQYGNGERLSTNGLEMSTQGAWNDGSRLWASLAWQKSRDANGGSIVNSPDLLARVNYSRLLPWHNLRLAGELQYDGRRYSLAGKPLGQDWLVNATLSGTTGIKGLNWSLRALNLFDTSYMFPASDTNWQDSLYQEGREISLRLNLKF